MDTCLVVGESLVDIVHAADGATLEYAGGSAANVAVALARLGRSVRFATAWADDARGAVLAAHLEQAGVQLAADPHVLARTATAAATIGSDGAASYEFDLEWRLGEVGVDEHPVAVHVCSLGAVSLSRAPTRCGSWSPGCAGWRRSATTFTPGRRSPAPAPRCSPSSSSWSRSATW